MCILLAYTCKHKCNDYLSAFSFFCSWLVNYLLPIYTYTNIYIQPHNPEPSLRWEKEKKKEKTKNNCDSSVVPTMNQSVCSFWLYFAGLHFLSGCNLTMSSPPWHYSQFLCFQHWVPAIWCKILLEENMIHSIRKPTKVGFKLLDQNS